MKCDRTQPACAQCQKHGVQCAGYARARKFMDEGPVLRRKFGQSQTRALPASIDELVAPSLVSKSVTSQQPTVFHSFILTAFPCFFGLNKHRVHVPWTTYVADQLGTSAALDAAVYCINWAFMGRARGDATLQKSSWEMYSTALGSIRDMFNANAAYAHAIQSRNTLAAVMVLCMFEAYARTARDRDAWTKHASGAGVLMSLRGPALHLSGFDRCLYLSFRSFLVAQAFIQGSPCLFERPEWQALIHQIRDEDMRDPRVDGPLSTLVGLSDRLFGEIVRIPGYVARARLLHLAPAQQARDWVRCVAECYHTVRMLDSDLRLAVAMRGYDSESFGSGKPFIGPIPSRFPHDFAGGLLRATESSLRILRLLLSHLDSEEYRVPGRATSSALVSPRLSASAPPAGLPFRIISKSHIDDGEVQPGLLPVEKWLDQVASSMGMDALEVIADYLS
jgi:hypothetical protein